MPEVAIPKEKWSGRVRAITLGATAAEGGTRSHTVTVGGETTLPFLHFEGEIPNRPVVAIEVVDRRPADWPAVVVAPGAWRGLTGSGATPPRRGGWRWGG